MEEVIVVKKAVNLDKTNVGKKDFFYAVFFVYDINSLFAYVTLSLFMSLNSAMQNDTFPERKPKSVSRAFNKQERRGLFRAWPDPLSVAHYYVEA